MPGRVGGVEGPVVFGSLLLILGSLLVFGPLLELGPLLVFGSLPITQVIPLTKGGGPSSVGRGMSFVCEGLVFCLIWVWQ